MPTKTLHIGGTTEFQKVGLRSFGSQMTSSPAFCTHYITSSPTTYMCKNIKSKTLSAKKKKKKMLQVLFKHKQGA